MLNKMQNKFFFSLSLLGSQIIFIVKREANFELCLSERKLLAEKTPKKVWENILIKSILCLNDSID